MQANEKSSSQWTINAAQKLGSDPLLDRTLVYITTGAKSSNNESKTFDFNEIFNSKLATPAKDNMFMDLKK